MTQPCKNEPTTVQECEGKRWMVEVTPAVVSAITGRAEIQVIDAGLFATMEYNGNRARVWLNADNTVHSVTIG